MVKQKLIPLLVFYCLITGYISNCNANDLSYFAIDYQLPEGALVAENVTVVALPYSGRSGAKCSVTDQAEELIGKIFSYFGNADNAVLYWPHSKVTTEQGVGYRIEELSFDGSGDISEQVEQKGLCSVNGSVPSMEMIERCFKEQQAGSSGKNIFVVLLYDPKIKQPGFASLLKKPKAASEVDRDTLMKFSQLAKQSSTAFNLITLNIDPSFARELRPLRETAFSSGGSIIPLNGRRSFDNIASELKKRLLGKIDIIVERGHANFINYSVSSEKNSLRVVGRSFDKENVKIGIKIPALNISTTRTTSPDHSVENEWRKLRLSTLVSMNELLGRPGYAQYEQEQIERTLGVESDKPGRKTKIKISSLLAGTKKLDLTKKTKPGETAAQIPDEIPAIYQLVPTDTNVLYCPGVSQMVRFFDFIYFAGSDVLNALSVMPDMPSIEKRIFKQCGLTLRRGMGALYDNVAGEVVMCGNEIDLGSSVSMALIFQAGKPGLLKFGVNSEREKIRRSNPDIIVEKVDIEDREVEHFYTPDRTVDSYTVFLKNAGDKKIYMVISNNKALFVKILRTYSGKEISIVHDKYFSETFITEHAQKSGAGRNCFVYFPEMFFQRLIDPEHNLLVDRRSRCLKNLDKLSHATLLLAREKVEISPLTLAELQSRELIRKQPFCPDRGSYLFDKTSGSWRCTIHNSRGFSKVAVDTGKKKLSKDENELLKRYAFLKKINVLNYLKGAAVSVDLSHQIGLRVYVNGIDRSVMKIVRGVVPDAEMELTRKNLQKLFDMFQAVEDFLGRLQKIGLKDTKSPAGKVTALPYEKLVPRELFLLQIGKASDLKNFLKKFFEDQASRTCVKNIIGFRLMYSDNITVPFEQLSAGNSIRCPGQGRYFIDPISESITCTVHGDGTDMFLNKMPPRGSGFNQLLDRIDRFDGKVVLGENGIIYDGAITNPGIFIDKKRDKASRETARYVQHLRSTSDFEFVLKNYYQADGYIKQLALQRFLRQNKKAVRHLLADFGGPVDRRVRILEALKYLYSDQTAGPIEKKLRRQYKKQPDEIQQAIDNLFPEVMK
jgi:hypothetical protein